MLRQYSDKGSFNLVDPWVIFGRDSRIVTIFSPIISSQQVLIAEGGHPVSIAEQIYGSLMLLGRESREPVKILINSPGGHIQPGFLIIQGIEHLKAMGITVITVNMCQALSMAGVILMMGTKGHRYVLEDALTLTHYGERQLGGRTDEDVQEAAKNVDRLNQRLYKLICDNSDIPEFHVKRSELDLVSSDTIKTNKELRLKLTKQFLGQNVYLSPEETVSAGMVDKILVPGDPVINDIYNMAGDSRRG